MISERLTCRLVQGHEPLAAAFAFDGEHAIVDGEHLAGERDQLRHAKTRGIERFEGGIEPQRAASCRPVGRFLACPLGGVEQPLDFGERKNFRKRPPKPRTVDCRAGVVAAHSFGQEKTEELADGRELPRAGGGREPLACKSAEEGADLVGIRSLGIRALGGEESEELREIARIGINRVGGRSPLR
jgi:hypothetical protein